MCPCYSLRVGSALLAFAVCVALSARVLFGADASAFLNAALAGEVMPVVWIWGAVVMVGLWQFATGLNAALEQSDPIRSVSLAWSAAALWLATYYLPHTLHPSDFTPWNRAALQAILLAWAAEHAANVWLQLRGLFRRRQRIAPLPALTVLPDPPRPTMTRRVVVEETYFGGGEVQVRTWEMPPTPASSVARPQLIEHDGRALPPPAALPSLPPIRWRAR